MERSDWDDDDLEAPAPLPAHERIWRHPSEVGAETWARTEPPIVLGRALTATTGAIGVLLAGAIVLALLPTRAGQPYVSARSVVSVLPSAGEEDPPPSATTLAGRHHGGTPSTSSTAPIGAAALLTPPTYHVADDPSAAIAVSIGDLVLTTATAAAGRDTVELALADGSTDEALVLAVDTDRGLALLAPHRSERLPSFSLADVAWPGDTLTIGDGSSATAVLLDGGGLMSASPLETLHEGTPLLDRHGNLVALLTHGTDGPRVVLVDALDDLRWALLHLDGRAGSQLGIALDGSRTPSMRIATVIPEGPGALAGLQAGDVIVAVNGRKVHHCDSLIAALAERRPGDTVVLTVRRDGENISATVVTG